MIRLALVGLLALTALAAIVMRRPDNKPDRVECSEWRHLTVQPERPADMVGYCIHYFR
jgi:hypothetical protein